MAVNILSVVNNGARCSYDVKNYDLRAGILDRGRVPPGDQWNFEGIRSGSRMLV